MILAAAAKQIAEAAHQRQECSKRDAEDGAIANHDQARRDWQDDIGNEKADAGDGGTAALRADRCIRIVKYGQVKLLCNQENCAEDEQ